jgi:hypothetical protein
MKKEWGIRDNQNKNIVVALNRKTATIDALSCILREAFKIHALPI